MGKSFRGRFALYVPLLLLLMFLAGYVMIGLLLDPNLIVAGILLGGSIFVCIVLNLMYDIVERVRKNERLQVALEKERQANQAKTIFLSNISHDIRTPMNAIIGYTRIARKQDCTEAEMRSYLEKIDSSSHHLLALINDVLEMSRIESGKVELEPVPTDLRAVMKELREMFASQMDEKRIRYTVETSGLNNYAVLCDRNRLNRILLNLVSNACKFTPEGGNVLVRLTQTGCAQENASYELLVQDAGMNAHISKPLDPEKMLETIASLLPEKPLSR